MRYWTDFRCAVELRSCFLVELHIKQAPFVAEVDALSFPEFNKQCAPDHVQHAHEYCFKRFFFERQNPNENAFESNIVDR